MDHGINSVSTQTGITKRDPNRDVVFLHTNDNPIKLIGIGQIGETRVVSYMIGDKRFTSEISPELHRALKFVWHSLAEERGAEIAEWINGRARDAR